MQSIKGARTLKPGSKILLISSMSLALSVSARGEDPPVTRVSTPSAPIAEVALGPSALCILTQDAKVWKTDPGAVEQWEVVYDGVENRTDVTALAVGDRALYIQTLGGKLWRRGLRGVFRPIKVDDYRENGPGFGRLVTIGDDLYFSGGPLRTVYRYQPSWLGGKISRYPKPSTHFSPRLMADDSGGLYAWSTRTRSSWPSIHRWDPRRGDWDRIRLPDVESDLTFLAADGAFLYAGIPRPATEKGPQLHVLSLTDWSGIPGTDHMGRVAASGGKVLSLWYDTEKELDLESKEPFVAIHTGDTWTRIFQVDGYVKTMVARGGHLVVLTDKGTLTVGSLDRIAAWASTQQRTARKFEKLHASE